MVISLPTIKNERKNCEGCIYGKMHKLSFRTASWSAKAPLVHRDIWGATKNPSFGGKKLFSVVCR